MKKVKKLDELEVGQRIYADEGGKKELTVRSLEDKLVPYVIATDNNCYSLDRGIWSGEP